MRRTILTLAITALTLVSACSGALESPSGQTAAVADSVSEPRAQAIIAEPEQAAANSDVAQSVERKIIRQAELTIESEATEDGYRKIAALADARGGYVVNSEAARSAGAEASQVSVTVVVRVPAQHFDAVVEEIRRAGSRVLQDKRTGKDVTEEYVDIEARLRAKKAVEAQFLEIMKRADKVADALEVQRQLGEVRAEIEQIEGRRRFLENQASLSTITVRLKPPAPLLASTGSGFFSGVREAIGDGVDAAASVVLGLIRVVIALIPIFLFIVLPIALLLRYLIRRSKRARVS